MSKKMLIGIGFILAGIVLFLCGCEGGNGSMPTNWDVTSASSAWMEVKTGTILKTKYERKPKCDSTPVCDQYRTCHGSTVTIVFVDGSTYLIGMTRRFGTWVEGSFGTLYKYDEGRSDDKSWFQWVEDDSMPKKVVKPKTAEQPKTEVNTITKAITTEWHNVDYQKPEFNKIVLIEFKNGLFTVAHYNRQKEWKADVDKEKLSGGYPLSKVARWKSVDLR